MEKPSFQSGGGTSFQALIGVAGLERKQEPLPLLWLHIGTFFQTLMRGARRFAHKPVLYTDRHIDTHTDRHSQICTDTQT